MTYYKVVSTTAGHRRSSVITGYDVAYEPGVPSHPSIPGSKLFIFSDLGWADAYGQALFGNYREYEVWECEATGVVTMVTCWQGDGRLMPTYWQDTKSLDPNFIQKSWPMTMGADTVTLTKRLDVVLGTLVPYPEN